MQQGWQSSSLPVDLQQGLHWLLCPCAHHALQAWRTFHHPKRGRYGSRPKVHMGFQKCWRRNNFDEAVCPITPDDACAVCDSQRSHCTCIFCIAFMLGLVTACHRACTCYAHWIEQH